MEIDVTFLRFISICAVLLLFGMIYAYVIADKPFPPKWTWASVAIGDFVTDFGSGAILWLLTHNLFLAILPFICHGLTGGPMIIGQLVKHRWQDGGEVIPEQDDTIEVIDGDGTEALAGLGR